MSAERPAAPIPPRPSPANLRRAIGDCRACDLWEAATQAVMGEGPRRADVMLVGETSGDREDLEGHPFVGPTGGVLDATSSAGSGGSIRRPTAGRRWRAFRGSRPRGRS